MFASFISSKHRFTCLAALAAAAAFAGADHASQARDALRWEVIQEYGTQDPPPNSRLGGSAFGEIVAARPLSDGRIVVLDGQYKKVVLFAKDGHLVRTIGNGTGHGPGEFTLPIALDVSENRIAVFDYEANRVTVFDTLGKVLWTRSTPRAKQIVLVGDTLYGSYMPGRQFLVWRQPSSDLQSVTKLIPVSAEFLRDHNPRGAVAMLGHGGSEQVLVAHARPGLWFAIDRTRVSPARGKDLLGNAKYAMWQDVAITPGDAIDIVALSDRYVGIAYVIKKNQGGTPPKFAGEELAVFDRAKGSLVGSVDLTGSEPGVATRVGPGLGPYEVLVVRQEPYPRVVRMVLRGLR